MPSDNKLSRLGPDRGFPWAGLCIGLAGGLAEIVVVLLYAALTGADAASIARHVASAAGLDGAPAAIGVTVHMGLAAALGICLSAALRTPSGRSIRGWKIVPFMAGSLAIVWAINFFIVLPVVSPDFVHLMPFAVTLASKLAFGLAAAATSSALTAPASTRSVRQPDRTGVPSPA